MKRKTGQDRSVTSKWRPATLAVRGGSARSEWGETSAALFLTSGYAYDCAEDAAARFRGDQKGMTYSRLQNPTVEMLDRRSVVWGKSVSVIVDLGGRVIHQKKKT